MHGTGRASFARLFIEEQFHEKKKKILQVLKPVRKLQSTKMVRHKGM